MYKRKKIIEGQDHEIPYASTSDEESLRFMIAIASEENKELLFIDESNAFQISIILNPEIDNMFPYRYFILNDFAFAFPNMK